MCRWDLRTSAGVVSSSPVVDYVSGKDFARGTNFTCMATSGDGFVAVGSKDGKVSQAVAYSLASGCSIKGKASQAWVHFFGGCFIEARPVRLRSIPFPVDVPVPELWHTCDSTLGLSGSGTSGFGLLQHILASVNSFERSMDTSPGGALSIGCKGTDAATMRTITTLHTIHLHITLPFPTSPSPTLRASEVHIPSSPLFQLLDFLGPDRLPVLFCAP